MTIRKPTGGRGSNQYRTRGAPTLSVVMPRGDMLGADADPEEVAWQFHPDAAAWRDAGCPDYATHQRWVNADGDLDGCRRWQQMSTPHLRSPAPVADETVVYLLAVASPTRPRVFHVATDPDRLRDRMCTIAADYRNETGDSTGFGPADAVSMFSSFLDAAFIGVVYPSVDVGGEGMFVTVRCDRRGDYFDLHATESSAVRALHEFVLDEWADAIGGSPPDDPVLAALTYFADPNRDYKISAVEWA